MRDEISAFLYLYFILRLDPITYTENLKRLTASTTLKNSNCDLNTPYSADAGVLLDTSAWMRGPISRMGPFGSLSSCCITRGSAW
jgi:hypothetical protein